MTPELTFPTGQPPPPYRRIRIIAVVAIAMCVGSIIILTLLIPSPPSGGYLPLKAPSGVNR